MNRLLPPNLIQRQYRTRGGFKQTLYYARFYDWKHKRRSFALGEDFAQAKKKLAELKLLNDQHHDFDRAARLSETLFPWIDRLLAIKRQKPIATRHGYSAKHVREFFGDCELSDITNARMLEYRGARTAAVATINRELALIRSILILAQRDGALKDLPVFPFEEEHNERVRTASDIEYRRVLKALHPDDRDFAEIIREMGFRPKDIHAITPADINFINREIEMRRIRTKFGHKRPLPLSPRAWSILSRRAQGKQKHELLFDFSRHRIRTAWSRACAKLGIGNLWLYDLKATFATEKQRAGWPDKIVMEFLGHKTTKAFARYTRPTMDDLRAFIGANRPRRDYKRQPTTRRKQLSY